MKRKILISLLVVSFFNYIGCGPSLFSTCYSVISEDEINEGRPNPDESIKLILSDGREYLCDPVSNDDPSQMYYLKVDTAGKYVMGRGGTTNILTGEASCFKGVVSGYMIDSSSVEIISSQEYKIYWIKDNNRLSFEEGKCIEIKPEQGTGYFLWEPNESIKKISFDEIKEIQIKESDSYVGVLLISFLVTTAVLFAIMSSMDLPGDN